VLTMDAVDTFIADCHAALQETSPEPARGAVQAKAKKVDRIQHPLMCGASTGSIGSPSGGNDRGLRSA
jgi:hypothetical protein